MQITKTPIDTFRKAVFALYRNSSHSAVIAGSARLPNEANIDLCSCFCAV
jgi:hypothetical protein